MKMLFAAAAFVAAASAHAEEITLVLLNASRTDIEVEAPNQSVQATVLPGESAKVTFSHPQWLKMGQEALQFDIRPIIQLRKRTGQNVVIQVGDGGRLYLMPPETKGVTLMPPPQPSDFPINHMKKIDLI